MVTGILLAAGIGRRFGSQKLLAKLPSGVPVAVASWRNLKAAHDNSFAVIRHTDRLVKSLFEEENIPFVICNDAHLGMSRSLLTGIESSLQSSGWIIALGDMPFVNPKTIQRITLGMSDVAHKKIFRPTYHERTGNPVGLKFELLEELRTLQGDEGAREMIKRDSSRVHHIPVKDQGIIKDIDTQQDLIAVNKL
ncbi:nucleotidyltransferase family protein [Burkholderiales bacterium]|nr:nucleotidyltransferase family protein [Burkholderiales bacterium]